MSVEIFRTIVPVTPAEKKISYKTQAMFIGSCFTENMGEKLFGYKLPVTINPFGITYNPLSIIKSLERMIGYNSYSKDELSFHNGQYFSFDHHSKFSDMDGDVCLQKINASFENATRVLKEGSYLFLTFGTAYYYILNSSGKIVSNCHKLPEKDFTRKRLTVDEVVSEYSNVIPALEELNPGMQIVFTVSPIRHWKDGAHENQLSKSVLLLSIDELAKKFKSVSYFPAYELMMDELRDYRFYEEDMLHPTKLAVDFIWKRFFDCYIDTDTSRIMNEVEKILLAKQHRPFNTKTEAFQDFVTQQLRKIEHLNSLYPQIDLSEEIGYFKNYQK